MTATASAQDVLRDLADLWKTEEGVQGAGPGLQRLYTVNLVAFAKDPDGGLFAERVMRELTATHPGRYVLVCPATDPEAPPLQHFVVGHCIFSPHRDRRLCGDIVKLVAREEVLERLYGFTLALLVPDIPVELWWPGDVPLRSPFFRHVAENADRVWVDSSRFGNPERSLSRLAREWSRLFPGTILGDLNWIRFARWRALIAELFDGDWVPYLSRIRRVTVEYGEGSQPTRGILLASWLASRLGWTYPGAPFEKFPDRIAFRAPGGEVEFLARPVPVKDRSRDRIFAVALETGGDPPGLFTVVRQEDPECVSAWSQVGGKTAFSRTVRFEHLQSLRLLSEALRHSGCDRAYKGAMGVLRDLLAEPPPLPREH